MSGKKERIYHIISLCAISFSIIFVILYFDQVWARLWQAAKDFATSVVWLIKGNEITPTVNTLPRGAVGILPFDFSDFKVKLKIFGKLFIALGNIKSFFFDVAIWILLFVFVAIPFVLLILSMWLDGKKKRRKKKKVVHNHNEDTKQLQIFKEIEYYVWYVPKYYIEYFIDEYKEFLRAKKYYILLFCVVWALGLNIVTIAVEFVAYVLFILRGFNLSKIYLQFAKLAMDLTVIIDFIPHIVWVIVGLKIFSCWRRKKGMDTLKGYYEKNVEFLEEHKGSIFLVGFPRSGKSTLAQSMAQITNKIFRNQALKGMLNIEKQFPDFPWINIVNIYRNAEQVHGLPKLESWRTLIDKLERCYKNSYYHTGFKKDMVLAAYRKIYGYDFKNFLFDYDYDNFPMKHNNGLVYVDIFEALKDYGQLYKIYSQRDSLIMATMPIRADLKWEDYGNFPVYDGDSLSRTPEEVEEHKQWAHIMQWESLRVSKFVQEDNPYKYGFEYGVVTVPEWAKDRGNQITNRGKSKNSEEANAVNDGVEVNMKVLGQMATINNLTFFRFIGDDQRPDSLSAENRDLCTIVMITDVMESKVVLPFYAIEQAIGLFTNGFYDKWKLDKKVLRGDNTLRGYIAQKIFIPIFNHCERIENKFGVSGRRLHIWNGMTKELVSKKAIYWQINAHDYNGKFSTNMLQSYSTAKASRSEYGLSDFPVFQGIEMTEQERNQMASYFYMFMNSTFKEKKKGA